MKKRYPFYTTYFMLLLALFGTLNCCTDPLAVVQQTTIPRIQLMPDQPQPYELVDWREKARKFDAYVFDFSQKGEYMPLIWLDSTRKNVNQVTFGLYTVIGDIRQGYSAHVDFHESLTSLGALLSAGLVGIDKTAEDGFNYVKMVQNYFNSDNGWNIMMNNTNPDIAMLGGGYGRDWWYDVYPNVLYYGVSYLFRDIPGADSLQRNIADQFFTADSVLDGDYHYSYFNYATMTGKVNHITPQEDAAAGHAYVLYAAYQKFGDEKYLDGAHSAIKAMLSQTESRFYEVLLPFGAYVASRLNAEHGTKYDVLKLLNWSFDGCTADQGRSGWGVIAERWGPFDVHGLQGSTTDGGGYAFLMNTHSMAWPLVPMVRYEPQFASAIGKWMLNASNASRLFYPFDIDDGYQWLPQDKDLTKNVIAYEGIRKTDAYGSDRLNAVSPVALGDGPNWAVAQPDISMFSLYSSAYAGIYGSIIRKTNVDKILRLNCLATDFYRQEAYPTFLYYNPYEESKAVIFENDSIESIDLYDALTHQVIAKDISDTVEITLQGMAAALIVAIPTGAGVYKKNDQYLCNGIVVAYE